MRKNPTHTNLFGTIRLLIWSKHFVMFTSFFHCLFFGLTKVPILKEVKFGKMQLCRVEHLLNTFSTYLSSKLDSTLCNQNIGEGESNIDDKYVEKVFNKCSIRQSCIFPKFTSYNIGTLIPEITRNRFTKLFTLEPS